MSSNGEENAYFDFRMGEMMSLQSSPLSKR